MVDDDAKLTYPRLSKSSAKPPSGTGAAVETGTVGAGVVVTVTVSGAGDSVAGVVFVGVAFTAVSNSLFAVTTMGTSVAVGGICRGRLQAKTASSKIRAIAGKYLFVIGETSSLILMA
jgi:hypothetical protein